MKLVDRLFGVGYVLLSFWMFWPWFHDWPVTPFWFWLVAITGVSARGYELIFRNDDDR